MSSGLAWAQQFLPYVRVFLNVGIAGHGSLSIGSSFLVHKVSDYSSGKCFYPHPIVKTYPELLSSELLTVPKPNASYQANCGYDMEASAFFETGRRFMNAESVQSIKVVSDTPESDFTELTAKSISELIEKKCDLILMYAQELLSKATPDEIDFDHELMAQIQLRWKLSVSNQTILRELLCSAVLLESHNTELFPDPQNSETLKQYLSLAKQWVLSTRPMLNVKTMSKNNG